MEEQSDLRLNAGKKSPLLHSLPTSLLIPSARMIWRKSTGCAGRSKSVSETSKESWAWNIFMAGRKNWSLERSTPRGPFTTWIREFVITLKKGRRFAFSWNGLWNGRLNEKSTLPFLRLQLDRSSGMKERIPEQGLLNFWNERQNLFALVDREGKRKRQR